MPLYDYDCAACGRRFEVIHGVHADPPASCPLCGSGPIRKAISAAAVHYRGSGWAKKERRAAIKSRSSAAGDDDGSAGAGSGSSGSDAGSGASEPGSPTPAVPAAASAGEASTETAASTKSGARSKPPARTSD